MLEDKSTQTTVRTYIKVTTNSQNNVFIFTFYCNTTQFAINLNLVTFTDSAARYHVGRYHMGLLEMQQFFFSCEGRLKSSQDLTKLPL